MEFPSGFPKPPAGEGTRQRRAELLARSCPSDERRYRPGRLAQLSAKVSELSAAGLLPSVASGKDLFALCRDALGPLESAGAPERWQACVAEDLGAFEFEEAAARCAECSRPARPELGLRRPKEGDFCGEQCRMNFDRRRPFCLMEGCGSSLFEPFAMHDPLSLRPGAGPPRLLHGLRCSACCASFSTGREPGRLLRRDACETES